MLRRCCSSLHKRACTNLSLPCVRGGAAITSRWRGCKGVNPPVGFADIPLCTKGTERTQASPQESLYKPKPPLCKGRWVLQSKTRRGCFNVSRETFSPFHFCPVYAILNGDKLSIELQPFYNVTWSNYGKIQTTTGERRCSPGNM